MSDKWIITGGCGFVGSNLAASLLDDGHEVWVADNLSRVGSSANLEWLRRRLRESGRGLLRHVAMDTRSQTDIEGLFARHGLGTAVVAHLAGQVAMTTSVERTRYDFEVNALGAMNVLEAVRRYCPDAVVLFSSTNKVYGDLAQVRHVEAPTRWTVPDYPQGFDEDLPLSFHSPYGCSKGAADQYFIDYHRVHRLRTVVFRHSSMYGGRQFATYDQGWVGWFSGEVLRQKSETDRGVEPVDLTVSGDGKQVRDLLHAKDLVACYRVVAAKPEQCIGHAFNVGGGIENSKSVLELITLLGRLVGLEPRVRHIEARQSDQRVFVADSRRLTEATGWRPRVSVEEGLEQMLAWVRELAANVD
jgi:CDP-paratose 2-epimerase